jgi:hypothetical protein
MIWICPVCGQRFEEGYAHSGCIPIYLPETLEAATKACERVFSGDAVAVGVDFVLNCPLGEDRAASPQFEQRSEEP